MSHSPVPGDPTHHALNQLVTSGQLSPERAQAAYEASQGRAPERQLLPGAVRLDTLVVGLGSALLATALVLSTVYSRMDGDLDWSNYLVGILSTVALLGIAAGAHLLVGDPVRKATLMSWPGALGAAGAGMMIGLALDDSDATLYVMGLAVLAISVGGYLLVRQAPFVVTAIAGLALVYVQLFDDLFGIDDVNGDNIGIWVGLAVVVFAVLVTAAGWLLPTRDLSAILVGVYTVSALASLMVALMVIGFFTMAFAGLSGLGEDPMSSSPPPGPGADVYHNDAWLLILYTLLMVAMWSACWWIRGHEGYRILSLVALASVIPPATVVLAVDSPSWWGAVLAVLGGVALLFAALRALGILGGTPTGTTSH